MNYEQDKLKESHAQTHNNQGTENQRQNFLNGAIKKMKY